MSDPFGSIRFLKNLIGMWLLEECRRGWGDPPVEDLLDAAAAVRTPVPVIDVNPDQDDFTGLIRTPEVWIDVREAAGVAIPAIVDRLT